MEEINVKKEKMNKIKIINLKPNILQSIFLFVNENKRLNIIKNNKNLQKKQLYTNIFKLFIFIIFFIHFQIQLLKFKIFFIFFLFHLNILLQILIDHYHNILYLFHSIFFHLNILLQIIIHHI